jgi:putative DNA primase/helicase
VSAFQFADTIRTSGLTPPDNIEPEKLYRFPGMNKRSGNKAGWCRLFADGVGGVYGDFSQDLSASWQATRSTPFSAAQRATFTREIAESKAAADAERQAKHSNAAMRAAAIWRNAQPAKDDHPYLVRKGIKAHGARLYKGALVIPMREGTALHSLQFIGEDGTKRFLTNGRIKGCYFSIGSTKDKPAICIAEGFATGATIHEATGYPVAVAFNAGNLEAVAMAMRAKETTWT